MANQNLPARGAKRQYNCMTCGAAFLQWPSQMGKGTYCSRQCYAIGRRGMVPHNAGKRTLVDARCEACGAIFKLSPAQAKRRKFCSRECSGIASHKLPVDMLDRLFARVIPEPNSGCWLWLGGQRGGYGRVNVGNGYKDAHRVFYEALVGLVPSGLVLDHLCRVRCCVNPDHLEPVTNAENIRRGEVGKGPRSEQHRQGVSRATKARMSDPQVREQQRKYLDAARNSPKRREALAKRMADPEVRQKLSEAQRRVWAERKSDR